MKNKLKKIICFTFLIATFFAITGCSNDDYYGSDQNKRDCYNAGKCKTYGW